MIARLLRDGTIRGRVIRPDGKPAAGILVMTEEGRGRGYTRRVRVRTAADGSYELTVPSNESYFVEVADDEWAAPSRVEVQVPEGRPVEGFDFRLVRGTVVRGTLTIGPDRRPGEGRTVSLFSHFRGERPVATDAKGHYQIRVGPGNYGLQVPNEHLSGEQVKDVTEPAKNPAARSHHLEIVLETITVKDEPELIRDLWIPKPETGPISGRVVGADDPARGVAGAKVQGLAMPPSWAPTVTDAEGRFHTQRRLQKTVVHARSPDGSLGGLIEIRGEDREVVIPVSPTVTATGIILDERGHPMANVAVTSDREVRGNDGRGQSTNERFTPTVLTDDRGRFALRELLVGHEYVITVPAGKNSWHIVAWVKPQEAGPLELGTLQDGTAWSVSFRDGGPKAGDLAPDFEADERSHGARTLDGRPIRLADFRGKFVLLDFWATWCGPCIAEIPYLKAVHELFGRDPRFAMLGLSVDESIDALRRFQAKQKLPWMQGYLGGGIHGAIPDRYGVRAIPAFVLIGPDGKIVTKGMRGEEIQKAVSRALGGN